MGGSNLNIEGDEFSDAGLQCFHVVIGVEFEGDVDALIVIGRDDQMLVAVDVIAHFLRLMAGDNELGSDLFGELGNAVGSDAASPDELIGGAGAAFVVFAVQFPIEHAVVVGIDFVIAWERMTEPESVFGLDCQRAGEQKVADSGFEIMIAFGEIAFEAFVERIADALSGLHDAVTEDLCEIVIGEQEVDLVAEVAFESGGEVEAFPAVFRAVGVVVVAVDDFVEDEVPVGIVGQIGGLDELGDVGAMVVQVACHPDFA